MAAPETFRLSEEDRQLVEATKQTLSTWARKYEDMMQELDQLESSFYAQFGRSYLPFGTDTDRRIAAFKNVLDAALSGREF